MGTEGFQAFGGLRHFWRDVYVGDVVGAVWAIAVFVVCHAVYLACEELQVALGFPHAARRFVPNKVTVAPGKARAESRQAKQARCRKALAVLSLPAPGNVHAPLHGGVLRKNDARRPQALRVEKIQ